jgi:hypothetical protein
VVSFKLELRAIVQEERRKTKKSGTCDGKVNIWGKLASAQMAKAEESPRPKEPAGRWGGEKIWFRGTVQKSAVQ